MAYILKSTSPASVTTDTEANTMTIQQGFLAWVENYPITTCGTTIPIIVASASSKTSAQIEAEVNAAITAYIAANFPA